jgi:carboxylesterase 3/5
MYEVTSAVTDGCGPQPAKYVTHASVNASIPAWRYYYNASIANIQPAGFPYLYASHGSELRLVWGTYNASTATDQEVTISNAVQTAWANFAKDPSNGPGWAMVDDTGNDLACIGCNGDSGITVINEDEVDERCALFQGLYTATTPYF